MYLSRAFHIENSAVLCTIAWEHAPLNSVDLLQSEDAQDQVLHMIQLCCLTGKRRLFEGLEGFVFQGTVLCSRGGFLHVLMLGTAGNLQIMVTDYCFGFSFFL